MGNNNHPPVKNNNYPPVSFTFNVEFLSGFLKAEKIGFQSVSGLSVELQTKLEKDANGFEYCLPTQTIYSPLVLKRGLIKNTKILEWCSEAMLNFNIQPVNLQVQLLNAGNHQPLMIWDVINAWPQKWSVSDFNAENQNAIAIETLELKYQHFKMKICP